MINTALYDYVKMHLERGSVRGEIKKSLEAAGWKNAAVEEAFLSIENPAAYFSDLSKKEKKRKKIVYLIVSVVFSPLLAAVAGFFVLVRIPSSDVPFPDDKDLMLAAVSVPDKENAFFDLMRIETAGNLSEMNSALSQANEGGRENKAMTGLLEKNQNAIPYFKDSVRKPKFQDPAYRDPQKFSSDSRLSPLPGIIFDISKIISVHAAYLFSQGKTTEALDESEKLVELGQKIQDSQAPLTYYLAASFAKERGLERLRKIAAAADPSSVPLLSYLAGLERFTPNVGSFKDAMKIEYFFMADELDARVAEIKARKAGTPAEEFLSTFLDLSKSRFHFKPNQTKALYADLVRREIASIDKPCGFVESNLRQNLAPSSKISSYFTENIVGKIIYDATALVVVNLNDVVCREELSRRATQLTIALEAYRQDIGSFPDSLEQLQPKYIQEIPPDPYGGKLLMYSQGKRIIYSLGKDLVDSGGSEGGDWRTMPDPTFELDLRAR